VGRNTFEIFRSFSLKQKDDPTGVSDYLNAVDKYVVSSTLGDPEWENTSVLRGPLIDEVRALKQARGRDIVATGSSSSSIASITNQARWSSGSQSRRSGGRSRGWSRSQVRKF
jgi:dihydrofolate reductase